MKTSVQILAHDELPAIYQEDVLHQNEGVKEKWERDHLLVLLYPTLPPFFPSPPPSEHIKFQAFGEIPIDGRDKASAHTGLNC